MKNISKFLFTNRMLIWQDKSEKIHKLETQVEELQDVLAEKNKSIQNIEEDLLALHMVRFSM